MATVVVVGSAIAFYGRARDGDAAAAADEDEDTADDWWWGIASGGNTGGGNGGAYDSSAASQGRPASPLGQELVEMSRRAKKQVRAAGVGVERMRPAMNLSSSARWECYGCLRLKGRVSHCCWTTALGHLPREPACV